MNESPVQLSENPVYENIDKAASSDSFHLLENTNQTEKSGHSSGAFLILTNTKKAIGVIYDLYKMKQSHWLLCVGKGL